MHSLEASLALYATLRTEQSASRELSLVHYLSGAPLTQPLTNRATEAWCWALLAFAQVHAGQVQPCIRSGRRALALSQESKNVWEQINSMRYLTYGLLDAGASEEALGLMQAAMALARTLPPTLIFQGFLYGLSNVYHALQQWEEGGWQRASRMRRGVRAFWLGHRFTPCCSTSKARSPRFRQTRRSRAGVEAPGAAGSSRGLTAPLSSSLL
jgi:hypothetical protein